MTKQWDISIGNARFGNKRPLALIAGPCVMESMDLVMKTAKTLRDVTRALKMPFVFKCSFDKANRSSVDSFRGVGVKKGVEILSRVKGELDLPVLTDVHSEDEIPLASTVADVLQVPAFLCRQTDLVVSAVRTGRVVNVKKGQFLAPWDAENILRKADSMGKKHRVILTERGVSFGYNNLVADMRSLEVMKAFGGPVVFDATHAVQLPGGQGNSSGGQREFVFPLARAAVAVGVAAVFLEVHPDPSKALSDGPNSLPLHEVKGILKKLQEIDSIVKKL